MADQKLRVLIMRFLDEELGCFTAKDFREFLKECKGVLI